MITQLVRNKELKKWREFGESNTTTNSIITVVFVVVVVVLLLLIIIIIVTGIITKDIFLSRTCMLTVYV